MEKEYPSDPKDPDEDVAHRNYYRVTCEGKEAMTRPVANKAAKRRRGRDAYKCKLCKKWHVGNNRAPRKRKPKEWNRGQINA